MSCSFSRHIVVASLSLLPFLATASPQQNTMTGIFADNIRTLTVRVNDNLMAPPVLLMGTDDTLTIGFDLMGDDREFLRYSIYHCDADWTLSNITDQETFDGFNYADITEYAFSRATTVHYVHYDITLPNEEYRFTLSGNYLLQVYPESEPDDVLLQVRFMVSEGVVNLRGEASSRTDDEYNGSQQQLTVAADLGSTAVRDVYNDLKLVVTQNNRADNPVMLTHPSRVAGSTLHYEHLRPLIFKAGNEYRRFETVQTNYAGMGVADVEFHHSYYHHILATDTPRHGRPYLYDQTQHGRFLVREYNAGNPDTEADYTVVHFTLQMLPVPDADIYIDGDLTLRHFDDTSRMIYDSETGAYRKAMLLKQGAYNYQYLALPAAASAASSSSSAIANMVPGQAATAPVEGDFYHTVNEYGVALYYRAPTDRYDRLLGYTLIFSGR